MKVKREDSPQDTHEWGRILWEEPKRSQTISNLLHIYLVGIGVICVLFSLIIFRDDGDIFLSVILLIIGLISIIGIIVIFIGSRSFYPRRVYEKGLTFPAGTYTKMFPEEECFYFFSQIRSIRIESGSPEFDFDYTLIFFDIEESGAMINKRILSSDDIDEMEAVKTIINIIIKQESSIQIDGYHLLVNGRNKGDHIREKGINSKDRDI